MKNSKNDDTNTNLFTHMTDKNTIRKMCWIIENNIILNTQLFSPPPQKKW